ncbi:asialoglycoprotein receptor 1-like [Pelodytes ibericus]
MSKDYQDQQFLQLEDQPSYSKDYKMISWSPPPSSRLLYGFFCASTFFFILIIILIVALRNPGVPQQDRALQYKMGNLSVNINSKVDRLSQEDTKLMDKLKEIDTAMQKLLADKTNEKLQTDMQRVLSSLGKMYDRVKKLQVNGSEADSCPSGWSYFSFSCYYFSKVGKSWGDSAKLCGAKEAHLAVINTEEEQAFLTSLASMTFTWIGLTDVDGHWKWVDGTSYESTPKNWIEGQPDEYYGHGLGGGEDCAHLHHTGEWNDDHCSRTYRYACEKEM